MYIRKILIFGFHEKSVTIRWVIQISNYWQLALQRLDLEVLKVCVWGLRVKLKTRLDVLNQIKNNSLPHKNNYRHTV